MAAYLDQLNRVRRFLARIENQARASVDYDMGKKGTGHLLEANGLISLVPLFTSSDAGTVGETE